MAVTPTADDLDGYAEQRVYDDGTVVRMSCQQTTDATYASGWAYTLHYGALVPDPPQTQEDGTIRRYDNAHEDTKGHDLHVVGQPTRTIDFPGMAALWERFWSAVPKSTFDPTT
jgi:hypothetical protein